MLCRAIIHFRAACFGVAVIGISVFGVVQPAAAQAVFRSYECADGSQFAVAFYQSDPGAHIQIDGKSIELKKSLAVSGQRFSSRGMTLWIETTGLTSIKHGKRPVSVCREVKG